MCRLCGREPCLPRCPNAINKCIGRCDTCGEAIYDGDECYIDEQSNLYCSLQCALKYYGIKIFDGEYDEY